jgi:hypothetical protein
VPVSSASNDATNQPTNKQAIAMNVKSFSLGFSAASSVFKAIDATKRGADDATKFVTQSAKDAVRSTKQSAADVSDTFTSFFVGVQQATKLRSGSCRMIKSDENRG